MKKIKITFLLTLLAPFVPAAFAFADIGPSPLTAPSRFTNINTFFGNGQSICNLVDWVFWFIIVLSIVFTLVAGFKYLTSGGEAEKVKSAGATLLYVVIAIFVALIAKGFPLIISSVIGGGLTGV